MTAPLFGQPAGTCVQVALPVPIDSLFTYRVPDALAEAAEPGRRVLVRFSGRRLTGVVVASRPLLHVGGRLEGERSSG